MTQYDRTDRSAYITLGILFGAAVGMVAGILSAPKSGKETRTQLRMRTMAAKGRTKEQLSSQRDMMADKLNKTLDKSKQVADNLTDTAKDKVNKVADRAKRATEKAKADSDTRPPNIIL